ncbi:uncharacterized protein LOC141534133 isoform X1 [Cotesia typhae]|uniref:uncharacterized protein LOC141534133 isoform X1 n=1 Tax=Cotesia typhae TaxID=2053667 RepID=UPI003D68A2F5
MGNSSSHHTAAVAQEMGRGWTQSFPRELTRHHHHSQAPGHKVLPEPPNQRLRATNNGNIIHNGGTISGRRPSAFTLPHDLNKQGIYRSRSTSTSHMGEPRPRNDLGTQHCCAGHYRPCDGTCRENEMIEIKRFGSEPDLRYSPESRHPPMDRHSGYHYPERESRERESRYRGKKKYKAPAPPLINADGSSPDSYKWEIISPERGNCCRQEEEPSSRGIKPPPRKSRLFKTRAETKRQQSSWNPSGQQDCPDNIIESERERERRWVNDRHQQHQSHQHLSSLSNGKENGRPWREYHEQDDHGQWTRDERRSSKKFDGKNTLQRSLSSPEFQAELMQVAKKVRNKLNYNRRVGPIGAPNELKHENQLSKSTTFIDARKNNLGDKKYSRSKQSQAQENAAVNNDSRVDRRKSRSMEQFDNKCQEVRTCSRFYEERTYQEQRSRGENRVIRSQETRSYEERRMDSPRGVHNSGGSAANGEKSIKHGDERSENNPRRRKVLEKSTTYEESVVTTNESSQRNKINGRLEDFHHEDRRKESQFDRRNSNNRATEILVSKITRKSEETGEHMRTRSESPAMLRIGVRGQGSGRESTPEPPRAKENKVSSGSGSGVAPENPRKKRTDVKDLNYRDCDKRWSESNSAKIEREREKIKIKNSEKSIVKESKEVVEKTSHWNLSNGVSPKSKQTTATTTTKTFYTQDKDYTGSSHHQQMSDNQGEDIALKLRPTLPKKQLEIPRFSPSAAWRLLSAQETPGPNMSTASEEIPVMYEERIERLARPPRSLIAMEPRSSHDKSGDSGVSCDAGVPNDDSLDVTVGRLKTQTDNSRPTWTPQQDLGEESSSDAGVDSPPPMAPSAKFPPRAHVFSLSLPRDDNRHCVYTAEKTKDPSFNSLQKIKRSFGLGAGEFDRKHPGETLDDNWLLSTSAPTSLQHSQANQIREVNGGINGSGWDGNYAAEDFEDEALDEVDEKANFPVVMKPPSFSYLASGGHVMYLPASNDTEHRTQSLNYRNSVGEISVKMNNNINNNINITSKNLKSNEPVKICNKNGFINGFANGFTNGISNGFISKLAYDKAKELGLQRERSFMDLGNKNRKYPNFSKSCENISEMKQRSYSPVNGSPESLQDKKIINVNNEMNNNNCRKISIKPSPKSKRFTFQSTVRQIERRRLAEKLSREAEAKERQRKSELEAMRKVEEEFQRKRAKEKANIRQQLRLYSMDENSSSLPPASDSSHLSRADPDGAPSSSASSPTSAPPGKLVNNRKGSVSSDEYHRKKECRVQQQNQKQEPREYKDYRPKYYDWAPNNESSSHLEVKQTTVHPKIVCDIPKSSHVFVDANIHTGKHANLNSTPRSDNYRKDFAHGAVAARSSLASSDSELSQPNTRPHSRQNGNNKNSKPVRTRDEPATKDQEGRVSGTMTTLTRSASPARSSEIASSEEEAPVEPVNHQRNSSINVTANGFVINAVQPFVREKNYRPITFNPQPPPPIPT